MLSFKEIQKHFSDKENQLPQFVLKEYLQYKILDIIFSSKYGNRLVFMGGTAIRIVYGGDRFSEDLDFDNLDLTDKDFDSLTEYLARELERDGLSVEFRNTFKGVYHCYLKFPKILFENQLSPLKSEKILIRLDSFNTGLANQGIPYVMSKADIFAEIQVYPKELILAQKIHALFNRKRSKGRDIYDIVYLFSLTEPDYDYLKREIEVKDKTELFSKMKKLFTESELTNLARDVQPFLLEGKKVQQVEKFNLWVESND